MMRYLRKASPLFFLILSLLMIPQSVHAPLVGDGVLGYAIGDDLPRVGDSSHNYGNVNPGQTLVYTFWFQNKVEDGNIVGYSSAWGNNANGCPINGQNQVGIATFPVGFTPPLSGFALASGSTYTVQMVINTAFNANAWPCNSATSGSNALTGTETGIGTGPLVRLNQWVGLFFLTTDAFIVGGPQCANADPKSSNKAEFDGETIGNTNLFAVGTTVVTQDNGVVISNCSGGFGGDWIFGLDIQASGSIAGANQCLGNCAGTANTNTTSTINFNQSQTIFYLQQVSLQNAQVVNVTTVVGKNYVPSFGMTLFIALYATQGQCPTPLDAPFSSRCPGVLIQQKAFPNPQKGTALMSTSLNVIGGQWIAPAFSASRNGLVLNDTSNNVASKQTIGTIPALITSFQDNGAIKTNLKANLIATTGTAFPPPICNINIDLACFEVQSVCALSPSNCMVGGVVFLLIYMIIWFVAVGIVTGYVKTNSEVELHMPISVHLLIFISVATMFTVLGIFPLYLIVLEFLVVSILFGSMVSGMARGQTQG